MINHVRDRIENMKKRDRHCLKTLGRFEKDK